MSVEVPVAPVGPRPVEAEGKPVASSTVHRTASELPKRSKLGPARRGEKREPTHSRPLAADGTPLGPVIDSTEDTTLTQGLDLGDDPRLQHAASLLSHTEAKVARAMRTGDLPDHVVLVSNNVPCQGPLGCDTLLRSVMPADSRLDVCVTHAGHTWLHETYIGTGERIPG